MEQQILSLMQEGHRERALELMARAWALPVGRFCTAFVGSASEGEDLMQETFIEAWKAMDHFRAEASLRAWLFGIARNLCASSLRKRDRRRGLFARFFTVQEPGGTWSGPSEELLENAEQQVLLERALANLKPAWREAVLLHYLSRFSMNEVAAMLDISPVNARKRVSLGVAALRESLRPLLMKPECSAGGEDHETEKSMSDYQGPRVL